MNLPAGCKLLLVVNVNESLKEKRKPDIIFGLLVRFKVGSVLASETRLSSQTWVHLAFPSSDSMKTNLLTALQQGEKARERKIYRGERSEILNFRLIIWEV